MGTIILVSISIVVLLILVTAASRKKKPKPIIIFDQYSPNGKIWMLKLWQLYKSGETWSISPNKTAEDYEEMFGLSLPLNIYGTKVSAYWKDMGIVEDYLSIEDEKNIEFQKGSFHSEIENNLTMRWHYQYRPLRGQNHVEVFEKYNLNLHADEILYFASIKIDWYEEKGNAVAIAQGGSRFKYGGKISFATGALPVVRNSVVDFVIVDRGAFYITNKRIIFICETKPENRMVLIEDLLEFTMYRDGILLGKSHGKKPLILVPDYVNTLVPRDDLNNIIRVLYRIMSRTENQDFTLELQAKI
jgi:hypothetical protein